MDHSSLEALFGAAQLKKASERRSSASLNQSETLPSTPLSVGGKEAHEERVRATHRVLEAEAEVEEVVVVM